MATVNLLQSPLMVVTTPAELRALADKMDAAFIKMKLGQTTLVETWIGDGADIQWHFDFEKMGSAQFLEMQPHLFEAGDIIQHCGRAYEIGRTQYSESDKGYWVEVKGERDPIFCSKLSGYKVKRRCATSAEISRRPA